ncbi:N-acetyl-1-D-myo-inositol-2-amino-2-deoxy-alpha-D-glucopyranoside deacetylase [Skermania piniformis]|uniref:1D-myo-inositol 2-acetamido-2-deoxy-alpha-D-glucopyranoside deacetylase n=1 Tax=Skermania pinensis TaxID=39122 RepID=A0ABX8SDV4_9ACTN|nr:N-acetyl-1-D-myo-inositol-2-amino-2-deoxy-alpha-D-glucopyranoside deacetylase [Skermania piniformis]
MGRRLLLVHAHPDDESITTGGTIAHYARRGVAVTVVTCTLGEEGEVIGPRWAGLAAGAADQLGGYRIGELTAALHRLGVAEPVFLGGAGRWRDSGMAGTPAADHPRAFVNAPPAAPVAALVEILRELRPQVVVGYDPVGGYGHPDHIRAHEVTAAAVAASGEVAKLYWTVTDRAALDAAAAVMSVPTGWRRPDPGELAAVPSATVTTGIDVRPVFAAKRDAMAAHATQLRVARSGTEFALTNNIAQPILPVEHFVLVRGELGPLGPDGREDDLFGGLE